MAVKDESFYQVSGKRRKGFPSESRVKRGFPGCTRRQRTPWEAGAQWSVPLRLRT